MAFYSFPVFATDFYNPFASHQLLWDDEDEVRPLVRRRDNGHNHNNQLVKSSDNAGRNSHDSLLRMPVPKFIKSFAPKFDVRETKEGYHLDGELPGLKRQDIDIEFSDPHTLLVKGEVKREYSTSNAEEEESEKTETTPESQISSNGSQRLLKASPHQATVEDTDEDGNPIGPPQPVIPDNRTVRKERSFSGEESGPAAKKAKKQHHHHHHHGSDLSPSRVKYWVSERTTGSFHRSFNFPSKVDQDGVKASLKDGLLSVFVPKQKEQKGKKKVAITVE